MSTHHSLDEALRFTIRQDLTQNPWGSSYSGQDALKEHGRQIEFWLGEVAPEDREQLRQWLIEEGLDQRVPEVDMVNHPPHYTSDPSGVECITVTRHRNFNIGNAIKYLWRAGLKTSEGQDTKEKQIEDLRKAIFYITDEINRLENS